MNGRVLSMPNISLFQEKCFKYELKEVYFLKMYLGSSANTWNLENTTRVVEFVNGCFDWHFYMCWYLVHREVISVQLIMFVAEVYPFKRRIWVMLKIHKPKHLMWTVKWWSTIQSQCQADGCYVFCPQRGAVTPSDNYSIHSGSCGNLPTLAVQQVKSLLVWPILAARRSARAHTTAKVLMFVRTKCDTVRPSIQEEVESCAFVLFLRTIISNQHCSIEKHVYLYNL